jgi:16S rRNA (cytosine967-C5)-methyltransferase
MQEPGRTAAAIAILDVMGERPRPLSDALSDWGKANRYAGSKDRAAVGGLVRDALRHRASMRALAGDETNAALVAATLTHVWHWPLDKVTEIFSSEPYGPGALSVDQRASLRAPRELAPHEAANVPLWLWPCFEAQFGDQAVEEGRALSARAPVDLRINTLQTDIARAEKAAAAIGGTHAPFVETALRLPVPEAPERAAHVPSIPAYSKGWLEVQDLGSQIAALAAGPLEGCQVLDFCAGGGGKTLSLGALMGGTGQIYAYDIDARRLMPTIARAKRADLRNLQVRSPMDANALHDLVGRMDCVFVDAPCTGAGTWRRAPDTKWRLGKPQFEQRLADQQAVLEAGAKFVKPGGALVYVVCSVFAEEGAHQVRDFLNRHREFSQISSRDAMSATGLLRPDAEVHLNSCEDDAGGVLITPARTGTDGFFIARIRRG